MAVGVEARFYMRAFGRDDVQEDYRLLHALSNSQVPQDPEGNLEWQLNRRQYDEATGIRRHYIAHYAATHEPVAYAAIEQLQNNPAYFRLYLVFDPTRWEFASLGEFLYQRLLEDAREFGAATLLMVEYASDFAFLSFLKAHNFKEVGNSNYNGFEIVRMELTLRNTGSVRGPA